MSDDSNEAGEGGGSGPTLPGVLPIFPLAGVLLLPRGRLPLNIFEPRYRAMTRDALGGERLIGIIQPADPSDEGRNPTVFPIGCAGRITAFAETDDGRFLITLTGVSRFRIEEELPLLDGYRRVVPDWQPFMRDLADDPGPAKDKSEPGEEPGPLGRGYDRERLMRGLQAYFAQRGLTTDWDAIKTAPDEHLVTSIAMACPFDPGEKQALLEAADVAERARLLTAVVEMSTLQPGGGAGGVRH